MDYDREVEYVDPHTVYRDNEEGRERFLHIERYHQYYVAEWNTEKPSLTLKRLLDEGWPPHKGLILLLGLLRVSVLLLSDTFHRLDGKLYDVSWENRGGSIYITLVSQTTNFDVLKYVYKVTTGEEMPDWWFEESKTYLGNIQYKSIAPEEEQFPEDDEELEY